MLSLTLLSLDHPRPVLAAIPFVLSLCFKQMALYYAPAIFIYLLSVSFRRFPEPDILLLSSLGFVVIMTFIFIFLPFLLPSKSSITLLPTTIQLCSTLIYGGRINGILLHHYKYYTAYSPSAEVFGKTKLQTLGVQQTFL